MPSLVEVTLSTGHKEYLNPLQIVKVSENLGPRSTSSDITMTGKERIHANETPIEVAAKWAAAMSDVTSSAQPTAPAADDAPLTIRLRVPSSELG